VGYNWGIGKVHNSYVELIISMATKKGVPGAITPKSSRSRDLIAQNASSSSGPTKLRLAVVLDSMTLKFLCLLYSQRPYIAVLP